jgi:hypothetical protein
MTDATRRGFLHLTGLGLASLALGCRSEESEAPPGSSASEKGEAGRAKPRADEPAMNDGSLRPFRLDFRSAGGHENSREGTFAIREWTSWLRVRSDERVAELILTRHNGDLVDRPVGRFRRSLDDAALIELQQAIEATKWDALPEPLIGDPTANMLEIDYVAGERTIRREFSASAHEFLAAIGPLMEKLHANMSAPLDQPLAALAVSASVTRGKGTALTMKLRNVGSEPIVITDPRVPSTGDVGPRAQLLVAQAVSGYQMPSWSAVDLPALPAGQPEVQVLAAGGELVIDVMWKPTLKGSCLLQAVWQDYAGPIKPVPDQLPFMPLAESGPSVATGPYPVRGAAFSSYATFDV